MAGTDHRTVGTRRLEGAPRKTWNDPRLTELDVARITATNLAVLPDGPVLLS